APRAWFEKFSTTRPASLHPVSNQYDHQIQQVRIQSHQMEICIHSETQFYIRDADSHEFDLGSKRIGDLSVCRGLNDA
ncbi:unnamed protein product, partial [Ilex paraguariensis]